MSKEPVQIDPKDAVEMYIWDGDNEEEAVRGLVVCQVSFGDVFVVKKEHEDIFRKGLSFYGVWYEHAKPIPEKKLRELKPKEVTWGMVGCSVYNTNNKRIGHIDAIRLVAKYAIVSVSGPDFDGCKNLTELYESGWTYELNGERLPFAMEVTE